MKVRGKKKAPQKKAIAFKVTPSSFDEDESSEDYDEELPCSLEKWTRCSIRKVDKATSEEEDHMENLKRKWKKWVRSSIAKEWVI